MDSARLPLLLGCAAITGLSWIWIGFAERRRPRAGLKWMLPAAMGATAWWITGSTVEWPARCVLAAGSALGLAAVGTADLKTIPTLLLLVFLCGICLCLLAGCGGMVFLLLLPWGLAIFPWLLKFTTILSEPNEHRPEWASDATLRLASAMVLGFVLWSGLSHRSSPLKSTTRPGAIVRESSPDERLVQHGSLLRTSTGAIQQLWFEHSDLLVMLAAMAWLMWIGCEKPMTAAMLVAALRQSARRDR